MNQIVAGSMPAPLYKYLDAKHADSMITQGSVKIGTLSEYRASEHRERGDAHEGELTLQSPSGRHVYGGNQLPPLLRNPGINIGPGALGTDGLGAVTVTSKVPDLFVYCATESFDAENASRFGDGCERIDRPEEFVLALDASLRAAVQAGVLSAPRWGRCVYEDRQHNWEREDLPAAWLLKPKDYQGQREIRVCWHIQPPQPLESIVLKVPSIIPYCTLLVTA
jgi:hypothetical protein